MEDKADVESVIEAGPFTRPSTMDQVIANLIGYKFTKEHIIELAPFVSQDVLDGIIHDLDPAQVEPKMVS